MTEQIDMSRFIEAKSDQLNADDLIGAPRTITVTRVTGNEGDQPIAIHYQGDGGKPFKPCKTIRRVLMGIWGRFANEYVGKSMTLYRDDTVTFGGLQVGGIRISHMSGIDKETTVVVMKSKGKKAGMKILPLIMQNQSGDLSLEDAEAQLRGAFDLDELRTVWSRKAMAPHRDRLQPLLDERKAALSKSPQPPVDTPPVEAGSHQHEADAVAASEGRDDAQHGDQFDGTVTLESAKARQDSAEFFMTAKDRYNEDVQFLGDEDAVALGEYHQARIQQMGGR